MESYRKHCNYSTYSTIVLHESFKSAGSKICINLTVNHHIDEENRKLAFDSIKELKRWQDRELDAYIRIHYINTLKNMIQEYDGCCLTSKWYITTTNIPADMFEFK